jgi:BirA family biotin operon repressor/biotin-[acetyl-CoA-carboxylase] ligase
MNGAVLQRRGGLARVRVYPRLRSTNSKAAELAAEAEPRLPAAVIALRQTAGRGRGANTWYSDAGSLTVTFALQPHLGHPATEVALRSGLAVAIALAAWVPAEDIRVKWPNDVLIRGRKVAGILCERVADADLIGIGLNVTTRLAHAPREVARHATTVAETAGRRVTVEAVFLAIAAEVLRLWDRSDWLEHLRHIHALHGKRVEIDQGDRLLRGLCRGLDPSGRLILDDGKRRHLLENGHVAAWEDDGIVAW